MENAPCKSNKNASKFLISSKKSIGRLIVEGETEKGRWGEIISVRR
jgi:hypothetical protein